MVIQKMLFKLHVYLPSGSFLEHQMQYHSPPFKGQGWGRHIPTWSITDPHTEQQPPQYRCGSNCGSERGSARSTKFYMDSSRSQKLSASWSWESLPCHHLSAITSCLLLSPFLRPLTTAIISPKGLLPPSKHPESFNFHPATWTHPSSSWSFPFEPTLVCPYPSVGTCA